MSLDRHPNYSMSFRYSDLPKDVRNKIDDYVDPTMFVYGVQQDIPAQEGFWQILYIFDEYEFYCININIGRSGSTKYIYGFVQKREPNVNQQIQRYIELLKVDGTVITMKKYDPIQNMFNGMPMDNGLIRLLQWLPFSILEYLDPDNESDSKYLLECEYDPEYLNHHPRGISNKKYIGLFNGNFILRIYSSFYLNKYKDGH